MPEMPDLNPEDNHTPESLEATLHEYAKAVRDEFALAQAKSDSSPEENAEAYAVDFAKQNMANSLAQIAWLSQNSTSESVRLNASKYLVDVAREDAKADGDPIKDLIKKLNQPTTEPVT